MSINNKSVLRIIDANFNRTKEGLRICEDICRFILDAKGLTRSYRQLRHELTDIIMALKIAKVIESRNIEGDVGTESVTRELKRKQVTDIFYANSQRVKESIRVLEEFTKMLNKNHAVMLKKMRYTVYGLEKKVTAKL